MNTGLDVEVCNAGLNGARICNVDVVYHDLLRTFSPDLLILYFGVNDNEELRAARPSAKAEKIRQFVQHVDRILTSFREEGTDVLISLAPLSLEGPVQLNPDYSLPSRL